MTVIIGFLWLVNAFVNTTYNFIEKKKSCLTQQAAMIFNKSNSKTEPHVIEVGRSANNKYEVVRGDIYQRTWKLIFTYICNPQPNPLSSSYPLCSYPLITALIIAPVITLRLPACTPGNMMIGVQAQMATHTDCMKAGIKKHVKEAAPKV